MILIQRLTKQGVKFSFECACGFYTDTCFTLEAAGRAADLHMAEMYPTPTERRPCVACQHSYATALGPCLHCGRRQ